jgi:hypothetical protein
MCPCSPCALPRAMCYRPSPCPPAHVPWRVPAVAGPVEDPAAHIERPASHGSTQTAARRPLATHTLAQLPGAVLLMGYMRMHGPQLRRPIRGVAVCT